MAKDLHSSEPERFLTCPACKAVAAKEETRGRAVVYVRCSACGERWTIGERRSTGREPAGAPRTRPPAK